MSINDTVSVKLMQGGVSSNTISNFQITAAAVPSAIASPGAVTLAYLQAGATFASNQLASIKGTSFDTPTNSKAVTNLANGLNSLASTLQPLTQGAASVNVGSMSGKALTMTSADLAQADGSLVAALVAENNSVQSLVATQMIAGVAPDFVIIAAASFGAAVTEVLDCASSNVSCSEAMTDLYQSAKQAAAANIVAIDVGGMAAMALIAGGAALAGVAVPVGLLIAMGTALAAATLWALSGMVFNTPSQQEAQTLGAAIGPAVNALDGQLTALNSGGTFTGAMGSVVDVLTGAQNAAAEEIQNSNQPTPTRTPTSTPTQTPSPTATATPGGACDGGYSGSYSGTVTVNGVGSESVGGGVAFTVSGNTITVSAPGSGGGTLTGSGGNFGVSGGVAPGASCSFGGGFQCVAGGAASAGGSWSCSVSGGSADGTWSASRN